MTNTTIDTLLSDTFGAQKNQPQDRNFLSPLGYQIVFTRMPNLVYFCQRVVIPGLTLGSTKQNTPFAALNLTGDHIAWGQLAFNFRLDNKMDTHNEILNWMIALAPPEEFGSDVQTINSQAARTVGLGRMSDAIVVVLTPENTPNIRYEFLDVSPVYLSEVDFASTSEDPTPILVTSVFDYRSFERLS